MFNKIWLKTHSKFIHRKRLDMLFKLFRKGIYQINVSEHLDSQVLNIFHKILKNTENYIDC